MFRIEKQTECLLIYQEIFHGRALEDFLDFLHQYSWNVFKCCSEVQSDKKERKEKKVMEIHIDKVMDF
jgi:hypothetical protein